MTVLIQKMSSTVVASVNRGTFTLAEWTVLPKKGVLRDFLDSHPSLHAWLQGLSERRREKRRLKEGFEVQNPDEEGNLAVSDDTGVTPEETRKNVERLTKEVVTEHDLAKELAIAIKKVAHDLPKEPPMRYTYEQWVHFTQLIRFSSRSEEEVELFEEHERSLIEWDWIGEDSPMLADVTEAQWVLDRLCESLNRYTRMQVAKVSPPSRFFCSRE